MLLKFKMGGSGIAGQGPGWIGGKCFKEAGEIVEIDPEKDSKLAQALYVSKMAALIEETPEDKPQIELVEKKAELRDKLAKIHIAKLRPMAGEPQNTSLSKMQLIQKIEKNGIGYG